MLKVQKYIELYSSHLNANTVQQVNNYIQLT